MVEVLSAPPPLSKGDILMLSDFTKVLDRLDGLALRSEHEAKALCPAHDDKNPSLNIKAEDGRLLLKCFARCSTEEVVAALNMEMKDLFADGGSEVVPFRPSLNRSTVSSASGGIQDPPPPPSDDEDNDEGGEGALPPRRTLKH